MEASISLTTLFWICSGIAGIYAVYKIIKGPFVQLDDHERRIKSVEDTLADRKETESLPEQESLQDLRKEQGSYRVQVSE